MEIYIWLCTFADSWYLLFMFVFFIGMVLFVFCFGSCKIYDDMLNMIFCNDDRLAPTCEKGRTEEAC